MKFIVKLSFVLISICLIESCSHSKEVQGNNDRLELIPEPDKALREEYEKQQAQSKNSTKNNIRFDFTASRMNKNPQIIEVKATLFNDNNDTVYFLSSTCSGDQYLLRYDTAKFRHTPLITCNASYPEVMKIKPHGQYNFNAHFGYNSSETKMELGFNFLSVSKSFDITNKSLSSIFDRSVNEEVIIWANKQAIK